MQNALRRGLLHKDSLPATRHWLYTRASVMTSSPALQTPGLWESACPVIQPHACLLRVLLLGNPKACPTTWALGWLSRLKVTLIFGRQNTFPLRGVLLQTQGSAVACMRPPLNGHFLGDHLATELYERWKGQRKSFLLRESIET